MNPIDITEASRVVRSRQPGNPRQEIWRTLHDAARERESVRERCRQDVAAERERSLRLLVEIVNAHHQLRVLLGRTRECLLASGLDAEAELLSAAEETFGAIEVRAGARVIDLTDQPYDAAAQEPYTEVVAAVPVAGLEAPRVRDCAMPALIVGSTLLQRAHVILEVPPPPTS